VETNKRRREALKCKDCDAKASWLLIDFEGFSELFTPLCEEHYQQLVKMEGEVNLDFGIIENLTLEDIIAKANEKWKYLSEKYSILLKQRSELKEVKRSMRIIEKEIRASCEWCGRSEVPVKPLLFGNLEENPQMLLICEKCSESLKAFLEAIDVKESEV
jgi:hypothetical protein